MPFVSARRVHSKLGFRVSRNEPELRPIFAQPSRHRNCGTPQPPGATAPLPGQLSRLWWSSAMSRTTF